MPIILYQATRFLRALIVLPISCFIDDNVHALL